MRSLPWLACLLFLMMEPAFASEDLNQRLAECAEIEDSADRLDCFDGLAGLNRDSLDTKQPNETAGGWSQRIRTSPIDDGEVVLLSLAADQEVGVGHRRSRPSLFIRCRGGKTDVYVNWGIYLGLETIPVLGRLDKEKAKSLHWKISTDREAIFYQLNDAKLAKSLHNYDTLVLQLTPYGESPVTASFQLQGLAQVSQAAATACQWGRYKSPKPWR